MHNFSLTVKSVHDVVVITPRGYVNDLGAETLEHTSEEYFGQGRKKIVINFSDMQFINSIGVSILTGIVQKAREHDGLLCFSNVKKIHSDVFEMLGITRHVKVFKEEVDALCFLRG